MKYRSSGRTETVVGDRTLTANGNFASDFGSCSYRMADGRIETDAKEESLLKIVMSYFTGLYRGMFGDKK